MGRGSVKTSPGFLTSYRIKGGVLRYLLFRFVPVFSVQISRIRKLRLGNKRDLLYSNIPSFWGLLRNQYWPVRTPSSHKLTAAFYLVETDTGRRVLLKMTPGFHYSLRVAIGRAQSRLNQPVPDDGEPPGPLSVSA